MLDLEPCQQTLISGIRTGEIPQSSLGWLDASNAGRSFSVGSDRLAQHSDILRLWWLIAEQEDHFLHLGEPFLSSSGPFEMLE